MKSPQAQTLVEVLIGLKDVKDKGITFIADGNKEDFLSYHQLYTTALSWLKYLQDNGLQPGNELVLQVGDNKTFIQVFWACILGAIIPVPVAISHHGENARKVFKIGKILNKPYLITDRKHYERIAANTPGFDNVLLLEEGRDITGTGNLQPVTADTIAFLQFSSGSTDHPKGIVLRHSNLIDNIYASLSAMACNEQDRHLSWMPLTHDMGLIGFHLYPLAAGLQHYLMPTDLFIRNPLLWLQKVTAHKITITASPNFGYKYYLDHFTADKAKGLNLSAVRIIFNGAEPVSALLCRRFMDTLAPYDLPPAAMHPVYGLAEATLDVTLQPHCAPFQSIQVQRKTLNIGDRVAVNDIPSQKNAKDSIEIVNVGTPIPGMAIKIVNEQGTMLPEGHAGIIRIKGKSVTKGYYNNEAATALAIREDGWLDTGDTGFMLNGCLYVAGRMKDIIIVNGVNVYPHDVEQMAETLDGIEAGKVVACGIPDKETASEAIVIFVLYKAAAESFIPLATALKRFIAAGSGLSVKHVIPVRKIFKTTSGKVQRYLFVEEYLKGVYNEVIQTLEQANRQEILTTDREAAIKAKNIRQWLEQWLQQRLRLSESDLAAEKTFAEYGMTSMQAVELSADIETFLQVTIDNTVVYNFPTPSALVTHLSGIARDTVAADHKKESPKRADAADNCIAVIGIGCRFPGRVHTPEAFWKLLLEQENAVTPVPEDRWNVNTYFDADGDAPGKVYTRQGGFIEQPGHFDPSFFGISPKEAACMDPQQRLLLEVCWEALEHAGYAPEKLRGSDSGIFIGQGTDDYQQIIRNNTDETYFEDAFTSLGIERSIAAGRIAYLLDFHGPVLQLDTACSSSLLGVHLACKSLLQEECSLALAGGVNLMLTPETTIRLCRMKALSPSDRCSAFDDGADGYVRGEGCGIVVLKRLSDALADGDNVLAVIRGSAVNHDGSSNGLTAPNGIAQQRLIEKALQHAGVDAGTVQYVEAHGTGTRLGDPVEAQALQAAYGRFRSADQPLLIGTVKTNIGHLEAAAGIAGFIKTVLCLQYKQIPASLHFREPNRFIPGNRFPGQQATGYLH
jgi:acyl-CoA synthetase (AMP-forming)/AMP-acid ligase II/3-oxoacyl-(acyl-carrier-protein) synthase/acyl carrier protein